MESLRNDADRSCGIYFLAELNANSRKKGWPGEAARHRKLLSIRKFCSMSFLTIFKVNRVLLNLKAEMSSDGQSLIKEYCLFTVSESNNFEKNLISLD